MAEIEETLEGTVENIIYRSESTDYTVLDLAVGGDELVTAVGTLPLTFEGEVLTLRGKWTYHKEFGKQFSFTSFEKKLPVEVDGMLQYLSSGTVKGVGPVTAQKIVSKFGTDTFDVIENHPEWLADLPGITMKKAAAIAESFREQNGLRGVMMFCKDYISVGEVTRVYKKLGSAAVGMITEDPYILCDGDYAIPFSNVDELAASIGFPPAHPNRVLAGARYVLSFNARVNGHTCLPADKLVAATAATLSLDPEYISEQFCDFLASEKLKNYTVDGAKFFMLPETAVAEEIVAKKLLALESGCVRFSAQDVEAMIRRVEQSAGIEYAALQKRAIFEALDGGVMILTGGPGTGKTTVVKALLSIFKSLGLKTVLAAPTGRAAKRMSEATSEEAKTVHRMLEMERTAGEAVRFGRNERATLDEDAVIVDEASMLDLSLAEALLRAMKRGSRLVLIGDADQLPSVGAGNVLADLIASGAIRTVCLTEIFRQSEQSLIVTNAHKIHNGEAPVLNVVTGDFFFVRRENERDIPRTVAELITERLPRTYGNDVRDKIQVITPSRKGAGGVEILNQELQNRINPKGTFKREVSSHGVIFREGDRVMQTVNNYDIEWEKDGMLGTGVFNGDIGVVDLIREKDEVLVIRFDDRTVEYRFEDLEDLELAYAITVHKSQGSEYPVVIIPMYSCPPMLETRNLFYTAVTRAKEMVILVGRSDIPKRMVDNNREILRYTTLAARISGR